MEKLTLEQLKNHIVDPDSKELPIDSGEVGESLFEMWYECLLDTAVYHATEYWEPLGMMYRYVGDGASIGNLMVEIVGMPGSFAKWIKQEYAGCQLNSRMVTNLEVCDDLDIIERYDVKFRAYEAEEKPH